MPAARVPGTADRAPRQCPRRRLEPEGLESHRHELPHPARDHRYRGQRHSRRVPSSAPRRERARAVRRCRHVPLFRHFHRQRVVGARALGHRQSLPAGHHGGSALKARATMPRVDHCAEQEFVRRDRRIRSRRQLPRRRPCARRGTAKARRDRFDAAVGGRSHLQRGFLARAVAPRGALGVDHSQHRSGRLRRVGPLARIPAGIGRPVPRGRRPGARARGGGDCMPHRSGARGRARLRLAAASVLAHSRPRPVILRGLHCRVYGSRHQLEGASLSRAVRIWPHPRAGVAIAMMRTLFLQAPSFEGFDGGAGARYQSRREIRSFWYPTWLAQPAAMVEGSKLVDAPPHRLTFDDIAPEARVRDLVVMHTSTPSFSSDVATVRALKELNPSLMIGLIGARVAVDPEGSLRASEAIDFVAGNEFDFTIKEVAEGRELSRIAGLSYRTADGRIAHNPDRPILLDMDQLPFVSPVYKRDLVIENYFIGYLNHSYLSFYTGRGCKSRCTFCLWPQTVGGHRYRVRSVGHVIEEIRRAKAMFPQVREFFFDDDTFTDAGPRAEAIAKELGKLGVTWSCNAKANVPRETLKVLKDNGLRLLLVGYESGNQQILHNIKKGMLVDRAKCFTKDCRELGIVTHGTFILGLPGETKETIEETIRFAIEINPHTLQ